MANNNFNLQALWTKIPKPIRNKYFIALVIVLAWMIFFDKHDFLTQWRLQRNVNQMEADKEYYSKKIEEAQLERLHQELNKEKFAREKYYMKRNGEDVFIIQGDSMK